MRLRDAARQGIARVRVDEWARLDAYLKLDLFPDGTHGMWTHLYERGTQEAVGAPTPQNVLISKWGDCRRWKEYLGPLDPADVAAIQKECDETVSPAICYAAAAEDRLCLRDVVRSKKPCVCHHLHDSHAEHGMNPCLVKGCGCVGYAPRYTGGPFSFPDHE